MAKNTVLSRKIQIDKAQALMVGTIAGTVFVTVFSLVSVRALWQQRTYQAKVISQKQKTRDTLKKNLVTVQDLVNSYKQFVGSSTNIIGGNPAGTGERDGDNARIVLDALPSKYDFPALTTSLEKILTEKNFKIDGIDGVDDEVAQAAAASTSKAPVPVPFQLGVSGSYSSIQDLIKTLERSIRPFNVRKLSLSGGASDMKVSIDGQTYYLPEKVFTIQKKVIKWNKKI